MNKNFTRLTFTDSVRQAQQRYGTRRAYARMEQAGDRYRLTAKEAAFIEARDSFYVATVGENGWPYVQFRGGPKGFLKVVDETTLGYADFRGNVQYISTGNLHTNNKASLILMDYPNRQRLKIWAQSNIIEAGSNEALATQLTMPGYKARVERLWLDQFELARGDQAAGRIPRHHHLHAREVAVGGHGRDRVGGLVVSGQESQRIDVRLRGHRHGQRRPGHRTRLGALPAGVRPRRLRAVGAVRSRPRRPRPRPGARP